ncbi:MAG: adenylate/guanylate cyclase domain-containing protein [Solirubrobacteraceae bacterium]
MLIASAALIVVVLVIVVVTTRNATSASAGAPGSELTHTFLFADLVGFTALAELEGDERALEVALELQRRTRGLLLKHRAEQVKAIGDGLMLRSSNAYDTIRLGVRLARDLAGQASFPPLRIGIHTGPALCRNGDWYGGTVNIAARLCAIAPAGGVIISEATRSTADRMTDLEWGDRELQRLRNLSQPIATYRVSTTRPSARRRPRAPRSPAINR